MSGLPGARDVAVAGHVNDQRVAREGLRHADPTVRAIALGALQRLQRLTDADVSAALADHSAIVRHRAVTLAAQRPHISLAAHLADPDESVVEVACWACGEHERAEPEIVDRLSGLAIEHHNPLVREAAVAALGAIGDERGLAAVLHGCADKPAIRRRAVLALAPFDGEQVEAALRAALSDRDWQVRMVAEVLRDARGPAPD